MSTSPTPCRVLYVEDNPGDAVLLQTVLSHGRVPFEVTVLDDGEEAMQFIGSNPFRPDVIVLDIHIPMIDGLTILAALKADPHLKSTPVLVFVSPNSPNSKRAAALKADLCMAKPCDLDGYRQLGQVIWRLLSKSLVAGYTPASRDSLPKWLADP